MDCLVNNIQPPPMTYMQQPHMAYMQQPPHMSYMQQLQTPVYRPEMHSSDGNCSGVPIGGFSGMLAGASLDVDIERVFVSQGRSEE